MKLQGIAVIFAIIILPITIILSYYIQAQVDTIAIQTSYDSKLMNATQDAMSALELNTANEDMSSVSDSLRSMIEASNSVFFNTLATNFGMSNASKATFDPYVPAILYTLYDGYYIYAPTIQPEILKYGDYELVTLSSGITIDGISGLVSQIYSAQHYDSMGTLSAEDTLKKNWVTARNGQPIFTDDGQMFYKTSVASGSDTATTSTGAKYSTIRNGQTITKRDYLLKSYMPYSARYTNGNKDITINYTLDNYINIEGTIGETYYTKTGYLIKPDTVEVISAVNNDTGDSLDLDIFNSGISNFGKLMNESDAEELIASGDYTVTIRVTPNDKTAEGHMGPPGTPIELVADMRTVGEDGSLVKRSKSDIENRLVLDYEDYQQSLANLTIINPAEPEYADTLAHIDILLSNIRINEANLELVKAVQYYVKNAIFSRWVYANLNDILESNIDETINQEDKTHFITSLEAKTGEADISELFTDFSGKNNAIFNSAQDPETDDSTFANHKDAVIRNSIQYNLNLAFTTYTNMANDGNLFRLPIMSPIEWDRITTRVSVVAFMQGMPCGTKVYNNYAIATSTNNEITVIPDEIYYVKRSQFNDEQTEAHRVDCTIDSFTYDPATDGSDPKLSEYISFRSKELKYDKRYNKNTNSYEYDHKNLYCYDCIVNKNLKFDLTNQNSISSIDFLYLQSVGQELKRRAFYIGIASEREEIYKTNALPKSEGYFTSWAATVNYPATPGDKATISGGKNIKFEPTDHEESFTGFPSSRPLKELKAIEIVIYNMRSTEITDVTIPLDVEISGEYVGSATLNLNEKSRFQTISLKIDPEVFINKSDSTFNIKLTRQPRNSTAEGAIAEVRCIYQ